jgi:hypothetical protein
MPITEKDLTDLMIGIVKSQASIVEALSGGDIKIIPKVQLKVGALLGQGKIAKKPITLKNLPAQLFLKALSPPKPNDSETLEQLARREFGRLLNKHIS